MSQDYSQPDRHPDAVTEVVAEYVDPEKELKAKFLRNINTPKLNDQQMHIWATTPAPLPPNSCMFAGDKPFLHCDGRYCELDRSFCPHRICTNREIYHDCHTRRIALDGANL